MANTGRPQQDEYAPYYTSYVANVTEEDVVAALEAQGRETAALLGRIGEEKGAYRYGPDKWSVKEVVGHVLDAERVFSYRAMAIARGETKSLPGFDEKAYVSGANFDGRSIESLAAEYVPLRQATVALFRNLGTDAWIRKGTGNNVTVSVRAIAYIALGHERHHLRILRERYGVS